MEFHGTLDGTGIWRTFENARIPSKAIEILALSNGVPGIKPKDALAPSKLGQVVSGFRYWVDVRLKAEDVFWEFPDSSPLERRIATSRDKKTAKLISDAVSESARREDADLLKVAFDACYPHGVPRGIKLQEVYNELAMWIQRNRKRTPPVRKTFDRHRQKFWRDSSDT